MRNKITIFLVKICALYLLWFLLNEILRDTRFWNAINSMVLREVLFLSSITLSLIGHILNFTIQTLPSNGIYGAPHDTIIFYLGEISGEAKLDCSLTTAVLLYI